MQDHLKDNKRQNKLIQLAFERTTDQNSKLASFFTTNTVPSKEEFRPEEDLAQTF